MTNNENKKDIRIRSNVYDSMVKSPNRAMLRATGMGDEEFNQPLIGVISTWAENTPCNIHLHDLGKVGIDDDILKSSKKLTPQEYEIMKNHTIYGQQRLNSIVKMSRKKSFLLLAAALAENHHEKWDGTGYPNGKKGFEIPLSARILAIADVYDALRRERPYKKALSHEEALKIILADKKKHFDPVLVDIFIENNASFNEAFLTNKNNIEMPNN